MTSHAVLQAVARRYPFEGQALEHDARPILHICGIFLCVVIAVVFTRLVTVDVFELQGLFACAMTLWVAGLALQCIRLPIVGEALKMVALLALLCLVAPLATAVLARISGPMADASLADIDKSLFFAVNWRKMVIAIDDQPLLIRLLNHAYCSLNWQPALLIFALCLSNKARDAWSMMQAFALTLAICIFAFPFAPAVGGYVHFGISPASVPDVRVTVAWDAAKILYGLKDGTLTVLGTKALAGIVTMPSFHVASALVLAWGAWSLPMLRWPFFALNGLMVISAVPVGGHYIIDTFAGAACAVLSIWIVSKFVRKEAVAIAQPSPMTA